MMGLSVRGALAVALLVGGASAACSQDARQNEAGQFDFYVLSLSWSPSFCAAAAERRNGGAPSLQCGARPYSFVVHGLWPQYVKGFPEYCQVPSPRLVPRHRFFHARSDAGAASDLQRVGQARDLFGPGAAGLFRHRAKARAAVKIPPEFVDLKEPLSVTPAAIEEAFIKANPGLPENGLAIECDRKRLTEVRICLSKDLQFRDCDEQRSCRHGSCDAAGARREGANSC